jgi:hypothetical protein
VPADPTEPSDPVVKTLFAHSRNVCAFRDPERLDACEEALTDPSWPRVKARICHIRGRRLKSARYDPKMTDEERRSFDNLILLCPTHHTVVDDLEPDRFTVEVLLAMKERAMSEASWAREDAELDRVTRLLIRRMRVEWQVEDLQDDEVRVEPETAKAVAMANDPRVGAGQVGLSQLGGAPLVGAPLVGAPRGGAVEPERKSEPDLDSGQEANQIAKRIESTLIGKGFTVQQVRDWWSTPLAALDGQPPVQWYNALRDLPLIERLASEAPRPDGAQPL